VGSLGSLGLVAEATLRTNPIPACSRWLGARDVDPFALRAELHRPSALLWDGTTTSLLLEGHPGDVEAELRRISSLGRFEELAGPPALPSRRWSLSPRALRTLDHALLGPFVASIGVGLVFAESDPPPVAPSPKIVELARRVKEAFDPSGRLSPGRSVWRRS
jgi:FAD/FMN-containing dehydrogenase